MLEKIDLTKKLSKKEYKAQLPKLQRRLYDLETSAWKSGVPSIIIFEGWDAAGKGTTISTLTQRLDPRGFKLYAIRGARTYEKMQPWLWRFWLKLPNYGEMAIFDRSWYGRVLVERVEELTPEREWQKAYRDIVDFERTIADDGYVLVKFWLHISKEEQLRRFELLEKDPLKSWQVTEEDWDHHRRYDDNLIAVEETLERTDTEWGPWTIVEATNRWWARSKVINTIIAALGQRLEEVGALPEIWEEDDEDFVEQAELEAEDAELAGSDDDDDQGG
jgi:polyphosphate kinase 2 (PPK2 family)